MPYNNDSKCSESHPYPFVLTNLVSYNISSYNVKEKHQYWLGWTAEKRQDKKGNPIVFWRSPSLDETDFFGVLSFPSVDDNPNMFL